MMANWQKHGLILMGMVEVKDKTVADIGCGDGWASVELKHRGAIVTAVDILPEGHYKLDRIVEQGIHYSSLGIRGLEGEHYDLAWCYHVLEHIPNPTLFLSDIRKVADVLCLAVPKCTPEGFAKGHINMYNMPLLVEHLRRGGWDVEHGQYTIYPGPKVGALWTIVSSHEGYMFEDQSTYAKYPEPMNALNVEGENHLRNEMYEWNWNGSIRKEE